MDTELRALLERIIGGMDAGFAAVDERFALVDLRFDAMQAQMRDGFISVDERLRSLESDVSAIWAESRNHTVAIATLTERVGSLEKRVDTMSDDMRQRFRIVIDRIAALEHTPRA